MIRVIRIPIVLGAIVALAGCAGGWRNGAPPGEAPAAAAGATSAPASSAPMSCSELLRVAMGPRSRSIAAVRHALSAWGDDGDRGVGPPA